MKLGMPAAVMPPCASGSVSGARHQLLTWGHAWAIMEAGVAILRAGPTAFAALTEIPGGIVVQSIVGQPEARNASLVGSKVAPVLGELFCSLAAVHGYPELAMAIEGLDAA